MNTKLIIQCLTQEMDPFVGYVKIAPTFTGSGCMSELQIFSEKQLKDIKVLLTLSYSQGRSGLPCEFDADLW